MFGRFLGHIWEVWEVFGGHGWKMFRSIGDGFRQLLGALEVKRTITIH